MQDVTLAIAVAQSLAGGHRVNFYGDRATGQIDYENPLNSTPIEVFEGVDEPVHLFAGPWATSPWLGVARLSPAIRLFADPWLDGPWLTGQPVAVSFEAGSYYFGAFQFAAKVLDAAGNTSQADVETVTVNSSPRAPRRFDNPTEDGGILSFGLEGSVDLES